MEECCPSDFSRQRAVVAVTPGSVMLEALDKALSELPPEPTDNRVESLLVQLEQFGQRRLVPNETRRLIQQATERARQALLSADKSLAVDEIACAFSAIRASDGGEGDDSLVEVRRLAL